MEGRERDVDTIIIDKVITIEEFPLISRKAGRKRNEMNGKSNVEINDLMEFNWTVQLFVERHRLIYSKAWRCLSWRNRLS